ncbi:methyltransferase [Nocardia cyriacigeorgica]|uniref:HemK2/MTQ2 family protein methyltransferase n=1 Tax=Nocardia cyriacigeorgica TaxID=135487 RepID=UPI0013BE172C|nr:HemK2/MTQ2 family protein methyltransferase [Nocardia cyriacigeorgica]NEW48464.1 methyltransferase [Nocardia cyriacigeorgica]
MRLICAPGVYRPQADSWLLARAMAEAGLAPGGRVLDLCTGTGAVAIKAAQAGAATVTAVDISVAALVSAWMNARLRRLAVELVHGDFRTVIHNRRFDVVLANPPYVPVSDGLHTRGGARAWDAGQRGRAMLDPLCARLPSLLDHNGVALLVQSAVSGPHTTVSRLRASGLKAAVVARTRIPFGPIMRSRAQWLAAEGLIEPGQRDEELVVIRADRTRP